MLKVRIGFLARASATFIPPAAWVLSGIWWMREDNLDALIFLLTDIVELRPIWAPWITYALWIVGMAFQYSLYWIVKRSEDGSATKEVALSATFYIVAILFLFYFAALTFLGE